jgi:hypothetical protein
VIEHKTAVVVLLLVGLIVMFLCGVGWQESQLHHAGLL